LAVPRQWLGLAWHPHCVPEGIERICASSLNGVRRMESSGRFVELVAGMLDLRAERLARLIAEADVEQVESRKIFRRNV